MSRVLGIAFAVLLFALVLCQRDWGVLLMVAVDRADSI
jgi:hypothetical protein